MASFVHVLGDIGRVAVKVIPFLPIPGVPGAVTAAISAVLDQELSGKPGPDKKTGAVATVGTALTAAGVPVEGKLQVLADLVEGVVIVLNALAKLFPSTAQPEVPSHA